MATHLDLQEQEQLDAFKYFYKRYGNLIVWALALALAVFAGINLWRNYERGQSAKAAVLYEEINKAVQAADLEKSNRMWSEMNTHFAATAYAQQAGLLLAKLQFQKEQLDPAIASLNWVVEHAIEEPYKAIASLRLAGVLIEQKKYDQALKQLDRVTSKEFTTLVADRRGDVFMAQGKPDQARAAYQEAWRAADEQLQYRSLIDLKLTPLAGSLAPKPDPAVADTQVAAVQAAQ
jgi:predicted negative regulator of RcsB-dependent stress response